VDCSGGDRREVGGFAPELVRELRAQPVSALTESIWDVNEPVRVVRRGMLDFFEALVFVPRAMDSGELVFAEPAGYGPWLCVFTSAERYYGYRQATGAPWPRPLALRGMEVLRRLWRQDVQVGVLVDPDGRPYRDYADTLSLTPALIAEAREQY